MRALCCIYCTILRVIPSTVPYKNCRCTDGASAIVQDPFHKKRPGSKEPSRFKGCNHLRLIAFSYLSFSIKRMKIVAACARIAVPCGSNVLSPMPWITEKVFSPSFQPPSGAVTVAPVGAETVGSSILAGIASNSIESVVAYVSSVCKQHRTIVRLVRDVKSKLRIKKCSAYNRDVIKWSGLQCHRNPCMKSPFFSVKHYSKEKPNLSSKIKKPSECQYAHTNICLKGSLKK